MRHQKGSILIVVILVAALISLLAVQIYSRLALDSRRTLNILDTDRAYYYALGAEELAVQILKTSLKPKKGKKDNNSVNLGQEWAKKGMVFPIEGGQLAGDIRDMSACFNLNSIISSKRSAIADTASPTPSSGKTPPSARAPSSGRNSGLTLSPDKPLKGQKLLEVLFTQLLPSEDITPKAMAARIRDWIDNDSQPFGADGAEDDAYLQLKRPYRTGNTLMGSVEELRTLLGFTAQMVETMAPYLCALPDSDMNTLNLNTIPANQPELLMMLYEDLPLDKAKEILQSRPTSGYDDATFKEKLGTGIKLRKEAKGIPDFSSDRFLINAEAIVGRGHARLQSLVQRGKKGNFSVIARRFASDFAKPDEPAKTETGSIKK